MNDVQIYASREEKENNGPNLKIFIFIFTLIILSIGVAGLSYYIGTEFNKDSEIASESQASPTVGLTLPKSASTKIPPATPTLPPKPKTPTPSATPTTKPLLRLKTLSSIADLDGFRSSNDKGNTKLEIRAGRNSELVTRGFVSFEIDSIPADADIQSATLKLYQTEVIGSPFGVGGLLYIDHLTYGDALDETDYAMPALTTNFASFDSSTKVGWKEVDVTSRLKDDVANARSMSQYRIHFETEVTEGDIEGDFVYFESQDNSESSDNTPQLVVKYY